MKNYVKINGVNSNTITGLMINELPPISKPEMRTLTEEIDGRDGDIITDLGYSSYDKTITIGLFGNGYDINDIIAFFNGEGTIVFSNEDDKYYNFKIINKIDYERLQKFKTASITFHCQPFKYPLEETPLEIEYEYVNGEGENITLNDTEGDVALQLDLKGNTSQYTTTGKQLFDKAIANPVNCTLTYTNGIYRAVATGSSPHIDFAINLPAGNYTIKTNSAFGTPIFSSNGTSVSNLGQRPSAFTASFTLSSEIDTLKIWFADTVDFDFDSAMIVSGTYTSETMPSYEKYTGGIPAPNPSYPQPIHEVSGDNEIYVEGKNLFDKSSATLISKTIGNNTRYGYKLPKATQNFYISRTTDNNSFAVYEDISGTLTLVKSITTTIKDITNSTNDFYLICTSTTNQSNAQTYFDADNFMMSYTTDTYEPYNGDTYELSLGDIKMRGIGTYEDYFVRNSDGQWCKYNAIGNVVLNGSETWQNFASYGDFYRISTNISDIRKGTTNDDNLFSNYFYPDVNAVVGITINLGMFCLYHDTTSVFFVMNETSVANFKTWLSTHNTEVDYILALPYLSLIENETLISQLDKIEKALAKAGQTNISQVNNDKAFIISATAMKEVTNEVEVENIGNIYARPTLDIKGNGTINVYKDNTQLLQLDMSETNEIVIEDMEAYNPSTNELMNRKVIGDYSKITCPSGTCIYKVDGDLTKMTISGYTRWL